MLRSSRTYGFIIILFIYILAVVVGIAVFKLLPGLNPLPRLFAADIAATLFVWLTGLIFHNSSIYDPYWSGSPPVHLLLFVGVLQERSAGILR